MNDRVKELLRNQFPEAGTDLQSSSIVSFLESLESRLDDVDSLVPRVLSVSLAAADTDLDIGGGDTTEQVTETVTVQNAAAQTVTWASSDEGVATVDASGLVTAVGAGTATITATSTVTPSVSGSIEFTVVA